ncbi:hypothetical protein AAVH_02474 [Aphelenchoides avenae]|nr:hypothetical protein AAVH_35437 [Aphelenchus avenae]KAH7729988.1 hypothetical protein AAVH_02474 [Aphelenchus avenae]
MNAGEKAKQSNPAEEKSKYLSRKAKYACTMCDTACDRFQRLQKHMKIVHNIDLEPPEPKEPSEKHYSCAVPDCDFVAPTKKLLHAHWREVHEDVKAGAEPSEVESRYSKSQVELSALMEVIQDNLRNDSTSKRTDEAQSTVASAIASANNTLYNGCWPQQSSSTGAHASDALVPSSPGISSFCAQQPAGVTEDLSSFDVLRSLLNTSGRTQEDLGNHHCYSKPLTTMNGSTATTSVQLADIDTRSGAT